MHGEANQEPRWALCIRTVSDLRKLPNTLSERVSQVLLGEKVMLLEESGDWHLIRMERDGYVGWIQKAALHLCTAEYARSFEAECKVKVLAEILPARSEPSKKHGEETGKIPFGVQLNVLKKAGYYSQILIPDGNLWWVESKGLIPLQRLPNLSGDGIAFTIGLMKRFIGVPYLWGGRSAFGFDCSGFTAAFLEFLGITLPRNADQQFQCGEAVSGAYQPGDLLFFHKLEGEAKDIRQQDRYASISHVAISLGDDEMIHAYGATWGVSCSSLNPKSQRYRPWLKDHLIGARRYI